MGKISLLFAGQGAQYPGMGRTLYENEPAARDLFDRAEAIRPGTLQQCFEGTKEELARTVNTQPCVFLVGMAAAAALTAHGLRPDMTAGFSLGEVAALTWAGTFDFETGFSLVCRRAELMDRVAAEHPGSMAAVLKLQPAQVEEVCARLGDLWPVNYNCPGQISVAGTPEAIQALVPAVKELGGRAMPVAVSGAFHSPLMASAAEAFAPVIAAADPKAPACPVYANRTARPYEADITGLLSAQIQSPVRFQETLEQMAADGADTFVEVGPGKTLSGFVSRTLPEARVFRCDSAETLQDFLNHEV